MINQQDGIGLACVFFKAPNALQIFDLEFKKLPQVLSVVFNTFFPEQYLLKSPR